MAHKFKSGDVVKLKSGGPKMTVAMVTEDDDCAIVHCSWFDKNSLFEKDFDEDLLAQYQPSPVGVRLSRS